MLARPAHEVLHEVLRLLDFPNVVVIRADPGQQAVGPDGLSRSFGQIAHNNAVVIGAWGPEDQLSQERVVEVAELQQFNVGGDVEQPLQDGQRDRNHHRREQTSDEAHQDVEEPRDAKDGARVQRQGHNGNDVDAADVEARNKDGGAALILVGPKDGNEAREETNQRITQTLLEHKPDEEGEHDAEHQRHLLLQEDDQEHRSDGVRYRVIIRSQGDGA